jgi:hypothetical protein
VPASLVVAPPVLAVEPPVLAEAPPELAVEPPVLAEAPPELAVEPPVLAEAPPELAVEPPVLAEAPPELAVEPPVTVVLSLASSSPPQPWVTKPRVTITPIPATKKATRDIGSSNHFPGTFTMARILLFKIKIA